MIHYVLSPTQHIPQVQQALGLSGRDETSSVHQNRCSTPAYT